MTSWNADAMSRTKPRAPTPMGTARKSASTSPVSRAAQLLLGELRAQHPHPAVDVEPDAARRDEPQWPSGMQSAARTIPGRQATLITCSNTPASICPSSVSEA
jgi:hypothetical protein